MRVIVNVPICPLMLRPACPGERVDEALFGMAAEVLDAPCPGWFRVRTHYGYTGYAEGRHLLFGEDCAESWLRLPKAVITKALCDVLSAPAVESWPLVSLTRGALVSPQGAPDGKGWQRIFLPDGREGYTKRSFLGPYYDTPPRFGESALRAAIVETAMGYLGTHYRWGGKTPMGIDCSGLASMAYLLNGVVIWRDAKLKEGYPLHPIPPESVKPADLLFFPGHVAIYLGDGRYLHSTAKDGSDGVVVNSLDPSHPDYRPDLPEKLTAAGSIF